MRKIWHAHAQRSGQGNLSREPQKTDSGRASPFTGGPFHNVGPPLPVTEPLGPAADLRGAVNGRAHTQTHVTRYMQNMQDDLAFPAGVLSFSTKCPFSRITMRPILLVLLAACVHAAILGVDYGQQFTKAVLLAPGVQFEVVLTDEGKRKDFSGVSIRSTNNRLERVYGSQIGSLCTRFPQTCIAHIKPLLGKTVFEPEAAHYLQNHFGVQLVEDDTRSGAVKFDLGLGNDLYVFSVEELLAMNLNEIKQRALSDLDGQSQAKLIAEDIVVSVPPFVSQATKKAYLDSIRLANFSNPLGLVDEGTAVALNWVSGRKFQKEDYNDKKIYNLIYDVGAGSTVATLFSYTAHSNGSVVLDIENIGFDEFFGGQLLTHSIYNIISAKFLIHANLDSEDDIPVKVRARLLDTAEKAKTVLSVNNEYHVSLESLFNEKDFKALITKDEFEEINSDLMDRITKPIIDALNSPLGPKKIKDLSSVILNGGSTRVPFILKHLSTLLGDKISKTVNADESCSLGTTLKGLKLKTKTEKSTDVSLFERSFHNYEISIDDVDKQEVVFKRGDVINTSSKLHLSELKDDVTVSLYEDGALLKTYVASNLKKQADKFKCRSESKDEKVISAVFKLDHNKVFDVSAFQFECISHESSGGFFQKLLKLEEDESETEPESEEVSSLNDTEANNTKTEKTASKLKKQTRPLLFPIPKPTYPGIKPLSRPTFERLFNKLAFLNAQDEERIQFDHVKNVLEALCYEFRSFIDDKEEQLLVETTPEKLEEYASFIRDTVEWLEFEGDSSSIDEVREKLSGVSAKKDEISRILEISNTDLSFSGFQNLYEKGLEIVMKVQSHMLDFGSEISDMRKKYQEEGFDFDKENDRIKMLLLNGGEDKLLSLDKNLASYKEDLTAIGDLNLKGERAFNKLSKAELYAYYEPLANKIVEMLADVFSIEQNHKQRMETFNVKFDKLLVRREQQKARQELKEKVKKAAAAAKEEAETQKDAEKNDEGASFEEEDDVENTASTEEQPVSEEYLGSKEGVHDEL